ncbi:MAG: deoxyribonuclease V [Thermodesulfovibrionales bacterium]
MHPEDLHIKAWCQMQWPKDTSEAKEIQNLLKKRVRIIPIRKGVRFVAGVDAAFYKDEVIAVACLYKYPEITPVEDARAIMEVRFPYIPGFLSFREGPAVVKALKGLKTEPDVILFDGQGIAHPRGLGIASHIGVLFDRPTVGCAKSRLIGDYREPGRKKGQWSPLLYDRKIIGAVLRTRDNVRPVFVSPGHRIDLESSIEIVLNCAIRYRIPEPLRRADLVSKDIKSSNFDF